MKQITEDADDYDNNDGLLNRVSEHWVFDDTNFRYCAHLLY